MGAPGRLAFARMQAATLAARAAIAVTASGATRHAPPPREGPLRVLMLASQPARHAATRHRLATWGDRLRRAGHDVELVLPVTGEEGERLFRWETSADRVEYHRQMLAARVAAVGVASSFDVAVVHLSDVPAWEYGPPFVAEALVRTAGRVLLDLDDLPVVRGEAEPGPRARRLAETVDGLVLGNAELRRWFPSKASFIVPTCIDAAAWPVPDRTTRSGAPVMGWIGTSGALASLEALASVLAEACARHGARLRVICDEEPRLPGVPVEFVRWRGGREAEDLAPIDIGLAPQADGPMARCKCGLKALEYAATGAAVVASPVGALREIVVPEKTGLHATTPGEWALALDRLLGDVALRRRMGTAGRAAVLARWTFDAHAAAFESALRGVEPGM